MKRYKALFNQREYDILNIYEHNRVFIDTELCKLVIAELTKMIIPFATNILFTTGRMSIIIPRDVEDAYIDEDNKLCIVCIVYSDHNFARINGVKEEAKLHNFQISFIKDDEDDICENIFTKIIPIREVEESQDNKEEWLINELNKIFKGV